MPFDTVKRHDTEFKIDASDPSSYWYKFFKNDYLNWEKDTFSIIGEYIDPNKSLIDMGAWVGPISLYYANKFKIIYAIEANKEAIEILKTNIRLNSFYNIEIIDRALYSKDEWVYFGSNEFSQNKLLNSSISQIHASKLYGSDYLVQGITFNSLMEHYEIDSIAFIKCDIEGSEEYILNYLLAYGFTARVPILVSFHYTWWKSHIIEEFKYAFSLFTRHPDALIQKIKQNPTLTVLFDRDMDFPTV